MSRTRYISGRGQASCTDHRASVSERQGLGHGRVASGLGFAERVAEDEKLAHAGDEGYFGRLAGRDEALVASAQRGVDTGGRQGGHVERGAKLGAPAPAAPPPAPRAAVAVEGRASDEGSDLLAGARVQRGLRPHQGRQLTVDLCEGRGQRRQGVRAQV